jgi:formylglycine-generating enzyme required for sulfatase activity
MLSRRSFLGHAGALAFARIAAQSDPFAGTRPGDVREVDGVRVGWCPPGRFTMGSPATEPGRRSDEAQVEVTISRGFWMAAIETTQGQWQRMVGAWPDKPPSAATGMGDDVPVYWVTYAHAEAFCRALTARARRAGTLPEGWEARLPTEAQWEYACRAGTATAFASGGTLTRADANFYDGTPRTREQGWPPGSPSPAAGRRANAWGLHDLHGNVFEWCRDWYHAQLPGGVDPDVQVRGEPNRDGSYSRVRRGGAWMDTPAFCRSALRLRYEPERSSDHIGFRAALVRT